MSYGQKGYCAYLNGADAEQVKAAGTPCGWSHHPRSWAGRAPYLSSYLHCFTLASAFLYRGKALPTSLPSCPALPLRLLPFTEPHFLPALLYPCVCFPLQRQSAPCSTSWSDG
jgi:hypothetical protein